MPQRCLATEPDGTQCRHGAIYPAMNGNKYVMSRCSNRVHREQRDDFKSASASPHLGSTKSPDEAQKRVRFVRPSSAVALGSSKTIVKIENVAEGTAAGRERKKGGIEDVDDTENDSVIADLLRGDVMSQLARKSADRK